MSEQKSKWPCPTVEDVETIIAMDDPILRNLKITQTYHELTVATVDIVGKRNINWCGFATWASKTAGGFIRKDVIGVLIQSFLGEADFIDETLKSIDKVLRRFGQKRIMGPSLIRKTLDSVTDEVAKYIVEGNFIVFEELAPIFARMNTMFSNLTSYNQQELDAFLSYLKPGQVSEGGQDWLIKAFTSYYRSIFENKPKVKAEHICLANALVGYHEQTRLQDPIINSMNAPIQKIVEIEIFKNVESILKENVIFYLRPLIKYALKDKLAYLSVKITEKWREITTRWMMTMELPNEILDLSDDVPILRSGQMFPAELADLDDPELVSVMNEIDRTENTTKGTGARDWGTLGDRMHFIVDLFRSRQQDRELYTQPFSDEQVDDIHFGSFPDGKL